MTEPMGDADLDELAAEIAVNQDESYEPSCYMPKVQWRAVLARIEADRETIAGLTAARDAALARAMPEPELMETVEQVEALPPGIYAINYPGYLTWWAFEKDEDGEWWQRGCESPWPPGDLVGCRRIGPLALPDLPIPTPTQEG